MSEVTLWDWLRPYCPRGHYTRVENTEAGPGTPDVNYRINACEGWLELKDAQNPTAPVPFKGERDGLHRTQRIWLREHVQFGGLVHVVARVGRIIYFIPGKYGDQFNGAPVSRLKFFSVLNLDMADPGYALRKLKQTLEGERP
jgi:hypothetical protein